MEEMVEPEEQGIACALGKICSLESRLRDAIQSTHSLTRSYGRDMGAVDRERAALLVIRLALFRRNGFISVHLSKAAPRWMLWVKKVLHGCLNFVQEVLNPACIHLPVFWRFNWLFTENIARKLSGNYSF